MGDRFPGQISIGGQICCDTRLYPDDAGDDTTVLQGLVSALHEDGGSHEDGDVVISADCEPPTLYTYLEGGLLNLKNDQAYNGEFQETEEFCVEHNIPFDRWSDHYCEYDAEHAYWRPGMKSPFIIPVDSHGNQLICGDTVRKALKELNDSSAPGSVDAHLEHVANALRLLREACPDLPPRLETFKIVRAPCKKASWESLGDGRTT